MVLTATGYFYTTLRLAGRWIETVYLVMIWNLLYQTVLRGLSVARGVSPGAGRWHAVSTW